MDIPLPDITPEEAALIPRVLAHYELPWTEFSLLPKWYRYHLRVRVEAAEGLGWQLRERSDHFSREEWHFHHYVQPTEPPLPTIPALVLSREGEAFVTIDDRDFELIGWLPGESLPITSPAQLTEAGRAIGQLHRFLFDLQLPAGRTRTVATTNNRQLFLPQLLREGKDVPALQPFIEALDALLAEPLVDPLLPVHGDIHTYNLIWQGDRLSGFCDWEDAHQNVPAFDLAYFLAHATFIDWPARTKAGREARVLDAIDLDGTERFLRAYREAHGRPVPARNLARAFAQSWFMTMRCTILTTLPLDAESIEAGHRILRHFTDPELLRHWQALLEA